VLGVGVGVEVEVGAAEALTALLPPGPARSD